MHDKSKIQIRNKQPLHHTNWVEPIYTSRWRISGQGDPKWSHGVYRGNSRNHRWRSLVLQNLPDGFHKPRCSVKPRWRESSHLELRSVQHDFHGWRITSWACRRNAFAEQKFVFGSWFGASFNEGDIRLCDLCWGIQPEGSLRIAHAPQAQHLALPVQPVWEENCAVHEFQQTHAKLWWREFIPVRILQQVVQETRLFEGSHQRGPWKEE